MAIAAPAMDTVDGRWRICTLLSFLGVTFLVFVVRQRRDSLSSSSPRSIGFAIAPVDQFSPTSDPRTITDSSSFIPVGDETKEVGGKCDIFDGKWVYDPKLSPPYTGAQCPFLSDQVSCQRNRRPDSHYERWSWEGNRCDIPRLVA